MGQAGEERMHQGWSVGVCLLMQSLKEREREGERQSEEGILAGHVDTMHMQSCRSNLNKIFTSET